MTQLQANRLAQRATFTLIQHGWIPDFDRVSRTVNSHLYRYAKSKGEGQTKSELASEMAKDILLSMSDKLNFADDYSYQFQQLFNQIYRNLSVDDKKVAKKRAQ